MDPFKASFATLPPELIQHIALLALSSPASSPALLLSLFQLNRRIYHALNPAHNHALYASLFKTLFDHLPIIRRLSTPNRTPHSLFHFPPASRLTSSSSSTETLTHHAPHNSLPSPLHYSPTAPDPVPDDGPRDREFSAAYVERMALFKRMRAFAALPPPTDALPGLSPPPVGLRDLWLIYLMVMENDGRNWEALVETAAAPRFMRNLYLYYLCSPEMDTLADFPQATPETALGLKLCHLFLDLPLAPLKPLQVTIESRLRLLKPYNFACHRYDLAYAPWTLRDLPLAGRESPASFPQVMTPRDRRMLARLRPEGAAVAVGHACELTYLNRPLTLLAPLVSHVASVSFFWATQHPLKDSLASLMRRPLSLRSVDYDLDFARARACTDPFRACGLAFDAFEGCFRGQWTGKFGFMAYRPYNELLGGNFESVFRGRYGDQPQSFCFAECLVRLRDARTVRFTAGTRARPSGGPREPRLMGRVVNEAEYLLSLPSPDEKDIAAPEEVLYEPDETYELQIHGSGHSDWGEFGIKGRVRGWDGLVTFLKVYRDPQHGRWLYRGYYTAGDMIVGRWKAALSDRIEGGESSEEEEDKSQSGTSEDSKSPEEPEDPERLEGQVDSQGCGERVEEVSPPTNFEDNVEEEEEGLQGAFIMLRL